MTVSVPISEIEIPLVVGQVSRLAYNPFCSFFANVESSTPSYPSPVVKCSSLVTDDMYRRAAPNPLRIFR
jgi:hypothetical protein